MVELAGGPSAKVRSRVSPLIVLMPFAEAPVLEFCGKRWQVLHRQAAQELEDKGRACTIPDLGHTHRRWRPVAHVV